MTSIKRIITGVKNYLGLGESYPNETVRYVNESENDQ